MTSSPSPLIRTAATADLLELQRVFRAASLSNADDAPLLLANPQFLVFAGDHISAGRTRLAVDATPGEGRVLGFATVTTGEDGVPELEDLFVDPPCQRRGIARLLVLDAARSVHESGGERLSVTANPHALAFYSEVGFVTVGTTSTELGVGHRMQLDCSHD